MDDKTIYELCHEKKCLTKTVNNQDSVTSKFVSVLFISQIPLDSAIFPASIEDSDQTAWMSSLI